MWNGSQKSYFVIPKSNCLLILERLIKLSYVQFGVWKSNPRFTLWLNETAASNILPRHLKICRSEKSINKIEQYLDNNPQIMILFCCAIFHVCWGKECNIYNHPDHLKKIVQLFITTMIYNIEFKKKILVCDKKCIEVWL